MLVHKHNLQVTEHLSSCLTEGQSSHNCSAAQLNEHLHFSVCCTAVKTLKTLKTNEVGCLHFCDKYAVCRPLSLLKAEVVSKGSHGTGYLSEGFQQDKYHPLHLELGFILCHFSFLHFIYFTDCLFSWAWRSLNNDTEIIPRHKESEDWNRKYEVCMLQETKNVQCCDPSDEMCAV